MPSRRPNSFLPVHEGLQRRGQCPGRLSVASAPSGVPSAGRGGGARAPTTTANPMKLPTILEQTIKDIETEVEEAQGLTSPLQLHPQLHQLGGALQVPVHLRHPLHRPREITQGVCHRVRCGVRRVAHQ
jgi:hypothetical protein